MMKDTIPCKVTAISTTEAWAMITAKDIFTDEQHEENFNICAPLKRPIVTMTDLLCMDCEPDGKLTLMSMEGDMVEHLCIPREPHL